MAMPAATRTDWTVDMLDALPDDGQRYEIIDGELFVTPAPADVHQLVLGELHGRFWTYLLDKMLARPVFSPSDVRREDRKANRVQPDLFIISITDGKRPLYPYDLSSLLLIIEILSPGNRRYDLETKRNLYMNARVPEYWVVDADARNITRWVPDAAAGEVLGANIEWRAAGKPHALAIDVAELFADALD